MIGPAEIEEMMAEHAETMGRAGAGDATEPSWPLVVSDSHLDEADKQLIGSYQRWIISALPKA